MTDDEYHEFVVRWMKDMQKTVTDLQNTITEMKKKVDETEQYVYWMWAHFC